MINSRVTSSLGELLTNDQILETLHKGLDGKVQNQRVLVLIPDYTRSLPLPFLFRVLKDNKKIGLFELAPIFGMIL